jgi:hypothetical protein
MLFLPYFKGSPDLRPARYGIAMVLFTAGMMIAYAFTATIKIPPASRFLLFNACGMSTMALLAVFPFIRLFPAAVVVLAVAGFANAGLNVFIMATLQLTVKRG